VDGIDVSVVLAKAVLAQLRGLLEGATTPDPLEIGGILLGRTEADGAGFRTFVDAFEPFLLEDRYGPNYTLSGLDSRRLERRRSALSSRRRSGGLVPVGLWRSHCRRGFYLDQRDFELFQRLFRHPASIFLLVRRDEPGAARGAVFVWENDDIRRHSSYLEFPLEAFPVAALPEPVLRAPGPPAWLRPAAMAMLSLALPLAAFYVGRAVALSRYRGAAVARANPAPPAPTPPPSAAPPDTRPAPPPPAAEEAPPDHPSLSDSRDRSAATPAARIPRRLEIPLPTRTAPPAAPSLPDPPPAAQKPSISSLPAIVAAAPAAPALHAEGVTAYIKPAPSSGIRHALRRIFTGPRSTEGFVPANPVAHPLPALPEGEVPASEGSVELLARIDRSGAVAHVRFSDGNSQLTDASASALSQWRFEPARQNGAPVDSDLLIRFEFRKKP